MGRLALILRWSWRDLRAHWTKVIAISLVIALGTGGYAGLTSTTEWRRVSYDASYAQLAMYDLRVDLATATHTEQGSLAAVVETIPHRHWIAAAEERLIFPTQVSAPTDGESTLVRGAVTGSDFGGGGPHVNGYHAMTGRLLGEDDRGRDRVMLERNFAKFYNVPATGHIAIGGDRRLEVVGQATTPEYFTVAPEGEMFNSEATFAGVFTSLATAQRLAGLPGSVNNLVLTLTADADRAIVEDELAAGLTAVDAATSISSREDNLSYAALTTDIDQDRAIFTALAFLLLAGAVGAAFNLIHRLVDQQRREIGVGMALGVRPGRLGMRSLLVATQIALLGVAFGVAVGLLIGAAMGAVFRSGIPLPVWNTAFPTWVFARVAAVGLIAPFVAAIVPVWRAVRVAPIDAIKPSYLTARSSRTGRPGTSGGTFTVMPLRNLRRTPRRTALTVLGIAAAITVLVGFLGIMDAVFHAVDTAEDEAIGQRPRRVAVALDGFYPVGVPQYTDIAAANSVAEVEPRLQVVGTLRRERQEIDIVLELSDLRAGMWRPTLDEGAFAEEAGVLVARKAAADLGVDVGDTVILRHPRREGLTSFTFVDSRLPVLAIHPSPVRGAVYMDVTHADLLGLSGVANAVNIEPAAGVAINEIQRELFANTAVASVQSATFVTEAVREAFDQMVSIIRVMVAAVLLLALLIAFNTAAINLEARAREHATMFAFGVRVRTALRMAVVESFILGVVATIIGIGGGAAMVWWITQRLLTETLPEFGLGVALRLDTLAIVVIMGVVAVAIAPLFTAAKMRRLDLPGTLRLVE